MKFGTAMVLLIILGLTPLSASAQAPHQIGGFELGRAIESYKDRIRPASDLPVRYMESVREVEVGSLPGFKSGLLWYGTCAADGRILRIKLKYADASKAFYDKLLEHFKQRFGEPTEWRGDPFHIVLAWKWSFTDAQNNSISLILQHNTRDEDEKKGNSVKLTQWSLLEAEQRCLEKRPGRGAGSETQADAGPASWDQLLPR